MGLVTMFCPLTMTGAGETEFQTAAGPRFVVDSKVKAELVGHDRTTLPSEGVMFNCGPGRVRLNTVPNPFVPPPLVVP